MKDNKAVWILGAAVAALFVVGLFVLFGRSSSPDRVSTTASPSSSSSDSSSPSSSPSSSAGPTDASQSPSADSSESLSQSPSGSASPSSLDPSQGLLPSSSPAPTSSASPSSTSGVKTFPVPDVSGFSIADAVSELRAAGFKVGNLIESPSESVAYGTSVLTVPGAGEQFPAGTVVDIYMPEYPASASVPTVKGKTWEAAFDLLSAAGVRVTSVELADAGVAGIVTSVSPSSTSTSTAGVKVALGRETLEAETSAVYHEIPDVSGLPYSTANYLLLAAGYYPVFTADSLAGGTVSIMAPAAGSAMQQGLPIKVTLS